MALLKLTNFGGELPRVKPRGLPDGAAQRYENLLATSASAAPSMALSRSTQSVAMPMLDTKYQRPSVASAASALAAASPAWPPPPDLAQPCEPLAPLADGIAATVLRWAVATVEQYQDCQRRPWGAGAGVAEVGRWPA